MIRHALLIFFILVSAAVTGEGATSAYEPTDVFFFNCGDTSDKVDDGGRKWTMENRKIMPSNTVNASFSVSASYQESGVSPGWKFLGLYFYPTQYGSDFNAVNSFFSVNVNGFTLLRNFSADLTVKASKTESKLIKEFIVPVYQTLNLTFTPSPSSLAFVNGIEIVSMPDRLYSKGGFDDVITYVGRDIDFFEIDNSTAFETVYRLNVGGDDVGDSGMFRRWLSDDNVILGEYSGITTIVPGIKINYTEKTPAYVAPDAVYANSRSMGNKEDPTLNLNFNLTWLFKVDTGFSYLVRLHFCETLSEEVNKAGQRVFSIFVENQMAMPEMDVFRLSGGSWTPMYLDYTVIVSSGNGPRHDLRLDLHPFTNIKPKYYDAILNGVEILKLNSSDGNLAGPNPDPLESTDSTPNSVTPPIGKGNKSHLLTITLAVVGSAIVLAMFVVVVIIIVTKRKKKKNRTEFSVHTTSKPSTKSSWGPLQHGTSSTNTRSATSLPSDLCRRFSISEIKSATNNFEKKLIVGAGGFGTVYKGRIDGGATIVAVKRLEISSNQGAKEFETELEMLSMLRHVHLVSLIGYCDEESEMVLVYEYMPHGTLKDHLYKRDKVSDPPLSWKRRLEICIGAARGLQYLHTGAKHTIIHRDEDIEANPIEAAEVVNIPVMRQAPRTRSGTRSLREEFNKSLESLLTLIEHEELKGSLLTKEIIQETPLAPRVDSIATKSLDFGESLGDDHTELKEHHGVNKDHENLRLQSKKQDIFFLPVLQGCSETSVFIISAKEGPKNIVGELRWHPGDVSQPPH